MSESDQHENGSGGRKYIPAVAAVAVSAAIVLWLTIDLSNEPAPPTSQALVSTTSSTTQSPPTLPPTLPPPSSEAPPTTTTTIAAFTARFSPFADGDVVSHTSPVPTSPLVANAFAEFYVDPINGDDQSSGVETEPVATLERARQLARRALRDADGDVVVYLRGGIHHRATTFSLGSRDSGQSGSQMIYRSYPGEQATIEGGVGLSGWEPAFGSVLVASVPDEIEDVRHFFAGGARQQRARTNEAAATAIDFLRDEVFGAERDAAVLVATDVVSGFAHPEDLELGYVGVAVSGHGITRNDGSEILRPSWKAHRLPVEAAIDLGDGTTRLDISNGALHHASERGHEPMEILPSDPFFLENALELLDEPGEWYFDSRERLLYWWPAAESATDDAWIARTQVLLALDGTLQRPVRNVRIEGIAFRHAGYNRPNQEGYVVSQAAVWFTSWKKPQWMQEGPLPHTFLDRGRPPGIPGAAIELDSVRDVAFVGNVFTEMGAAGVLVSNDAVRVTFDGNLFADISAEALVAGHPEHDEIDEPTEGPIGDIVFTNNVVDRAGAEFYASVGVQITKSDGAVVSNNLFRDLPYSAISLGWGWANNLDSSVHRDITVENNYFENVVNVLYDGAPIYLLGPVAEVGAPRSEYTKIRGNVANNLGAEEQFKAPSDLVAAGFAKRPGIQLDQGVRNTQIARNVFLGSTAWLQVTTWQEHRDEPGWVDALGLVGSRNWSDTEESVPDNTTLAGVAEVWIFGVDDLPEEVLEIIANAGLQTGTAIPPLP